MDSLYCLYFIYGLIDWSDAFNDTSLDITVEKTEPQMMSREAELSISSSENSNKEKFCTIKSVICSIPGFCPKRRFTEAASSLAQSISFQTCVFVAVCLCQSAPRGTRAQYINKCSPVIQDNNCFIIKNTLVVILCSVFILLFFSITNTLLYSFVSF